MKLNRDKQRKLFLILLGALLCKFLWPLFQYDVPLGYDVGLYRYLFLKHSAAFPPFISGDVELWARGQPLGLYFFSTILLKAGVPVDWLIGWIWNLFPVILLLILAWVTAKREGNSVGLLVLLFGLISAPYYDGFSAMYWKSYAALLTMVLTFHFVDRSSLWALLMGLLTLTIHNQTGLLLALVAFAWWLMLLRTHWSKTAFRRGTLLCVGVALIALLIYFPIFDQAIWIHVKPLLTTRGDDVASGAFPPALFYVRTYGIALLIGIFGFLQSLANSKRPTMWHLAVLISAAFVILKLFFYKRFFLHLDFFLLPFMAIGAAEMLQRRPKQQMRFALLALVLAQGYLSLVSMQLRTPEVDAETYALIQQLPQQVPPDAFVIAAENYTPTWIRGWLSDQRVGGPGLLSIPWTYEAWERLLYGTHEQRENLLRTLQGPVYFVLTPPFFAHYGEYAEAFVADSCFERIEGASLLLSTCSAQL